MNKKPRTGGSERGNALFLILIAVALFAALSYAITQSGRGSGTVDRETSMVAAGQVVQQPAAIRTAVTRMIITGVLPTAISFDTTSPAAAANEVFDATGIGGGATDVAPPTSAGSGTAWTYVAATTGNGSFIKDVGTNAATGSEGLAWLAGVNLTVCKAVQKGLGFASPYTPPTQLVAAFAGTAGAYAAGGSAGTISSAGTDAKAFACFENFTAGTYAYYHALIEQ